MQKILVVGANGMLAHDVMASLSSFSPIGIDLPDIDITSFSQVMECIDSYRPEIVINCAAYTAVDKCEENIDLAFRVNGEGVKNLAIACNKYGADLLHISSDYVFDGNKNSPYIEIDKTNPLSVYGKSKLYGEMMVTNHTNNFYILRTQWMYGLNGGNFVKTMLRLADTQKSVDVVMDQIGNPTSSFDLAATIAELITTKQYGIYHVTNEGGVSWHQFAQDIFKLAKKEIDVRPISSDKLVRKAIRPKFSVLDNMALRLAGFQPLRNYHDALEDYFHRMDVAGHS